MAKKKAVRKRSTIETSPLPPEVVEQLEPIVDRIMAESPKSTATYWVSGAIAVTVVLVGIVASYLTLPESASHDYSTLIAAEIGIATSVPAAPTPTPTPSPNGECSNCYGTGKVGDGRVSVTCAVCNGTGRSTTASMPTEDCMCILHGDDDCQCSPCECGVSQPAPEPAQQPIPSPAARAPVQASASSCAGVSCSSGGGLFRGIFRRRN
jgi:hypothetical protein